jgi:hypothetical protein
MLGWLQNNALTQFLPVILLRIKLSLPTHIKPTRTSYGHKKGRVDSLDSAQQAQPLLGGFPADSLWRHPTRCKLPDCRPGTAYPPEISIRNCHNRLRYTPLFCRTLQQMRIGLESQKRDVLAHLGPKNTPI